MTTKDYTPKTPITLRNEVKVQAALDKVQQRASARLLTVKDIAEAAADAEARLDALGVPGRFYAGATFVCDPHRVYAAYKWNGSGETTVAHLRRNTAGWTLVSVRRHKGIKTEGTSTVPVVELRLTPSQQQEALRAIQRTYRVSFVDPVEEEENRLAAEAAWERQERHTEEVKREIERAENEWKARLARNVEAFQEECSDSQRDDDTPEAI